MEEQTKQEGPEKVDASPTSPSTQKNTGMAVVAYILFFVPLLTESKDDSFVLYHVRQGFVLFVAFIIAGVITWIPTPLMVVGMLIQLALIVVAIMGIMHALKGEEKPLPVIGQFSDKAPF